MSLKHRCCSLLLLVVTVMLSFTIWSYASENLAPTIMTQRSQREDTLSHRVAYLDTPTALSYVAHIQSYWSLAYPNHVFVLEHATLDNGRLTSSGDVWTYRVDLTMEVETTLITPVEEHPIVVGMTQQGESLSGADYAKVSAMLEGYRQEIAQSYGVAQKVVAPYRLEFTMSFDPRVSQQALPTPTYYFQQNTSNSKTQMPSLASFTTDPTTRYQQQVTKGKTAVTDYLAGVTGLGAPKRTATYDPEKAAEYALEHGTDAPEYSYANGLGSDCANFVSRAVHAGGIPIDTANKWNPAPTGYAFGGSNWIRTGYNTSQGGVTLYLPSQNLFYRGYNSTLTTKGSILFYQDHSHVALVTYSDGQMITYAHRSNTAKEFNNYLHEGNQVNFYWPSPHILV